ncbi:MAG: hypothetical protein HYY05_00420 [Chloroflexi bacterium]|nr:hypothetical protein [Chloroflexota bacterium]
MLPDLVRSSLARARALRRAPGGRIDRLVGQASLPAQDGQARRPAPPLALAAILGVHPLLRVGLTVLALWLSLSFLHQVGLLGVARALAGAAAWPPARDATQLLLGDEVYAGLALEALQGAGATRLATRLPPGEWLAEQFPERFAPPAYLPGTVWIGTVFDAGSSSVGVHVARLVRNLFFLFAGLVLAYLGARAARAHPQGWRSLAAPPVVAALTFQTYSIAAQLHLSWSGTSGGHVLLSLVATKLLNLSSETFDQMVAGLGGPLEILVNLAIVALTYGVGLGILRGLGTLGISAARLRSRVSFLAVGSRVPGPAAVVCALIVYQTPLKGLAAFAPADQATPVDAAMVSSDGPVEPIAPPAATSAPSEVVVVAVDGGYEYRVNGNRRRIRCIGYNAVTKGDTPDSRAERYDRDFALLRASRVNTITGWDRDEFDGLLLRKASEHRLGVILPFEIDPSLSFADPAVRTQLLDALTSWVITHQKSPALRMWAVGNEVIHAIKDVRKPNAAAFAGFLLAAADLIHDLDPQHPVLYRDAEDMYLKPVADALAADGRSRPWLVYGMNFFTFRMKEALDRGPAKLLNQPLLISEFATMGLRPADRPAAYLKQWDAIRSHPTRVLGGCAYVWTTAGPEPLDRAFGMTDGDGNSVDGSLPALAGIYREEEEAQP